MAKTIASRHLGLLWIGNNDLPENVRQAVDSGWSLIHANGDRRRNLASAPVALIQLNGKTGNTRAIVDLLHDLECSATVGVFLLPPKAEPARELLSRREGQFLCVDENCPPEILMGKLSAAAELQPAIRNLHLELDAARTRPETSGRDGGQIDEEMRLAARIQRDFLPRRLPEVDPARFGVLFRPAGWLSGDIYDVIRLDETHVGFFVVDAVGHGMPAALLTMFIKKALQTKRIVGQSYEIVPPHISLAELNADICEQNLNTCHFCTAIYCVLDIQTLVLTYSRAGHPEPILCRADGTIETLEAPGSLLGVFPEEVFTSEKIQLGHGDRLVLYSDGAEDYFTPLAEQQCTHQALPSNWPHMPREEMLLQLAATLDSGSDCTHADDDVTVIVMDIIS